MRKFLADLKIGVMAALLRYGGINPWVRECDNINLRAGASSAAQFSNREEGTPSGHAVEVEESSLIESIIMGSVISISVRHSGLMNWLEKKVTGSWTIILARGEVKTLLNWSNNREHI